jgi:hypothetical protein
MRKSLFTILEPTSPVYDLTTVDAVNAALGITGNTASDAQLAIQITQASRMIGELCDRIFALLTVTEDFRMRWGDPTHALNLRQYPVTELTSVTQSGIEVDPQSYELDYESGLIWRKQGHWCGEIIIDYSGGYDLPDEAPALLAQACIETLRVQRFSSTHDPTIRSTTHGDTTVTFSDYYSRFRVSGDVSAIGGAVLPPNASDMIQQYKRLGV